MIIFIKRRTLYSSSHSAAELQVNCVQLLVNQSHKMMSLKCLATHIFNMMLRGCLLVYTYTSAFRIYSCATVDIIQILPPEMCQKSAKTKLHAPRCDRRA